jgi:hypothetical protein
MNKQPQYSIAAQGSSNQNRERGRIHDPCLTSTDWYQCTKGHKKKTQYKSDQATKPAQNRQNHKQDSKCKSALNISRRAAPQIAHIDTSKSTGSARHRPTRPEEGKDITRHGIRQPKEKGSVEFLPMHQTANWDSPRVLINRVGGLSPDLR